MIRNDMEELQEIPKTNVPEPDALYEVIPVMQETIQVDKKTIDTARIHISKTVTEHQQEINIPLTTEQYDIVRVPINQQYTVAPQAVRYEGDTMIVSVLKEVLVVEKRYELIEELHITKRITEETTVQNVSLRTENVTVERTPL